MYCIILRIEVNRTNRSNFLQNLSRITKSIMNANLLAIVSRGFKSFERLHIFDLLGRAFTFALLSHPDVNFILYNFFDLRS